MLFYINLILSLLNTAPANAQNIDPVPALASIQELQKNITESTKKTEIKIPEVPFYSQFSDIQFSEWRGKSCGVASLAMIVNFYKPSATLPQTLLEDGLASGAYLKNAGWLHSGLINLSKQYGLDGTSYELSGLSKEIAFEKFKTFLKEGPVMASIFYEFDPQSPIPHLVVVSGISDGKIYYNDPAETSGGKNISIEKFLIGWKQRFIVFRPATI